MILSAPSLAFPSESPNTLSTSHGIIAKLSTPPFLLDIFPRAGDRALRETGDLELVLDGISHEISPMRAQASTHNLAGVSGEMSAGYILR